MELRVGGVGGVSFAGRCSVSEVMVLAARADYLVSSSLLDRNS